LAATSIPEFPFARKPENVKLSLYYFDNPQIVSTIRTKEQLNEARKTIEDYKKLFNSLGFKIIDFRSKFFLPRGIFLYSQSIPFLANLLMSLDSRLNKYLPKYCALLIFLLRK